MLLSSAQRNSKLLCSEAFRTAILVHHPHPSEKENKIKSHKTRLLLSFSARSSRLINLLMSTSSSGHYRPLVASIKGDLSLLGACCRNRNPGLGKSFPWGVHSALGDFRGFGAFSFCLSELGRAGAARAGGAHRWLCLGELGI